jgi:hypothetical protein
VDELVADIVEDPGHVVTPNVHDRV